ncbi:MAG: NADH-quinone oxidoreductase subunit G [Epsilonproteobacteria bacterium]|nr:NADH-quinone oxidoreductase subunit G [Campylobacterota bacterium]
MSKKEITITIDGVECKTYEGEYILNVARANNIFIPAICYLTRCSPTLACRLCLVEADGKRVYACNAKAKDGMNITVTTEEIMEERRAIMEVYDVNHPLQCGVCDQHGECELQNYTLEIGVDEQHYAIKDTKREVKNFSSVLHYDAALCIVCERCVTVCKDMIGDSALKTGPRGGDPLDKSLKEVMPKDAYAMWNKLQKSIIVPSNGTDYTNCSDCGECTAVCPVGALTERDFVYKANPWELKEIPATCAHCSSGCHLYYETRFESINNPEEIIFRVKNEWNYQSLCGAGRFGYDFENRDVKRDKVAFNEAVEAIKKADTISFSSVITNEEALMLQTLKEKLGVKLVNKEVKPFQDFLKVYQKSRGTSLYEDSFKEMYECDFIISVGAKLRSDNPNVRYLFNNIQKMNKGAGIYFHPVGDTLIPTLGKNVLHIEHKPHMEEWVLLLILSLFASNKDELPNEVKIDEEEILEKLEIDKDSFKKFLDKALKKKESFALVVGEDLYYHPKRDNLAKLTALIKEHTPFKVALIPPKSNALGVALICELDDKEEGFVVGYNQPGDFTLSALGDGNLDMPAMNQQEGTLTNMNKRVTPTYPALPYGGYELNDILKALGLGKELTISWTKELPKDKGFKEVDFDSLDCYFKNDGSEVRGYILENKEVEKEDIKLDSFNETPLEGVIAYRANPQRQFNDFTNKAHQIFEKFALYISPQKANELEEGSKVKVIFENGGEIELEVAVDDRLAGDIVEVPDFLSCYRVYDLFGDDRYAKVTIKKV